MLQGILGGVVALGGGSIGRGRSIGGVVALGGVEHWTWEHWEG